MDSPIIPEHRRIIGDHRRDPARYGDAFRPLGEECHTVQFNQPLDDTEMAAMGRLFDGRPDVTLYVYGGVKDLEFLRFFPALRSLQLAVWDIGDISGFRHLSPEFRKLIFPHTKARFSLRFLAQLNGLRDLFLQGHKKDFDVVTTLTNLESLGLHGVELADLKPLQKLGGLKTLRLGFGKIHDLSLLPRFEMLENLRLMRITELADVDVLAEVTSVKSIDLDWLTHVPRLPDLSRLARLEVLRLDTMKGLRDIAGAAAAPLLRKLTAGATPGLTSGSFQAFVGHPALRELYAYVGRTRDNEAIKAMFPGIAR